MWKAPSDKLKVVLPEGFHLIETEDFIYLLFQNKKIACFSSRFANPEEIKKMIQEYLSKGGR